MIKTLFFTFLVASALLVGYFNMPPTPKAIPHEGEHFFPKLLSRINTVEEIQIRTPKNNWTIKRSDKKWQLNQKKGISIQKIRGFLLALAEAKIIEPKTRDQKLFASLNLDDKHLKSKIQIKNAKGQVIMHAYFGMELQSDPMLNRSIIFARKALADQAYLIEASLPEFTTLKYWTSS